VTVRRGDRHEVGAFHTEQVDANKKKGGFEVTPTRGETSLNGEGGWTLFRTTQG